MSDELMHYGVQGMRWGVRRKPKESYVTVRQAGKNAKLAGKKAFKDSIAKDKIALKGKLGGARKAGINARQAARQAMKESLEADKNKNKQIRNESKISAGKKAVKKILSALTTPATSGPINPGPMKNRGPTSGPINPGPMKNRGPVKY